MEETFDAMLTGGHPNSLGRTVEVVEAVLAEPARLAELYDCYSSDDEVVRLRVSSAMKRVQAARPDLIVPYFDRLIDEIGALDQASAQWTLAILFQAGAPDMTAEQFAQAKALVQRNLAEHDDWIVLNTSIDVLTRWAREDADLRARLEPQLQRLRQDGRKSVVGRAEKALKVLASMG
ncbi:MAG: hypothetical protein AAGA06_11790 [Pseudomonadota bacterium]